jgi:prepilin-type N-terminal cleavage/methylation domain-containing protein
MSRRNSGFTLIELLVVIAIIAILAAILFPVFARARAKAQANSCLSNTKQLTLGVMMYMSDYDDFYPPCMNGWANPPTWKADIYPYVKNPQIFSCPSNAPAVGSQSGTDYIPGTTTTFYQSYAINGCPSNICGSTPANFRAPYYGIMNTPKPAETIVICESNSWWSPYWDNAFPSTYPQINALHSRQTNYGFCAGHAKSLMPTATNSVQNMWTLEDDGPCTTQNLYGWMTGTESKTS